jgi:hypothetical protein
MADGLSCNTSLLELRYDELDYYHPHSHRIISYTGANQVLKKYLWSDQNPIFYKLWAVIYAKVSGHPAVLHYFVQETDLQQLLSGGEV